MPVNSNGSTGWAVYEGLLEPIRLFLLRAYAPHSKNTTCSCVSDVVLDTSISIIIPDLLLLGDV